MTQILKSLFISGYPLLCIGGLYLAYDQYMHQYPWAALGLMLISLTMPLFLAKLFLTNTARTDKVLLSYSALVGIGTLILTFAMISGRAESIALLGYALAFGWFLYLRWYSTFSTRKTTVLNKGQRLPRLEFEYEDGCPTNSDNFRGYKSILLFYRGNWCPLCMAQIKEIADSYKVLKAKGIQTILISPQPHSQTKKLADKYDVDFKFLVDKDNKVARQLDIVSENGLPAGLQLLGYSSDTVLPTVILVDEHGLIIHSDLTENYRVRPEPDELMGYFNEGHRGYVWS